MHSIIVSQTMDNTQCNCDGRLLHLSHTFKESRLFMVFIINTLLYNTLKYQTYTTSKIHTLPQIKLMLGSKEDGGCLTHMFPFSVCFIPLQPPPVYVNQHQAEWRLPLPTLLWTDWPDSQKETQKSMVKNLGEHVKGSYYGAQRHWSRH